MTIGPRSTFNAARIGIYDSAEDDEFDSNNHTGGMKNMDNAWYLISGTMRSGCCSEGNLRLDEDDLLEFRRVGDVISVFVNEDLNHTFSIKSRAQLRPVIGRSAFSNGRLDIDDIVWTAPSDSSLPLPGDGVPQPEPSDTNTLNILLNALLGGSGDSEALESAVVFAPVAVTPAFAINTVLTAQTGRRGRFEIGVVQSANAFGYRAALTVSRFPLVQILRSDGFGDTIIGVAQPSFDFRDGRAHFMQLTRTTDGILELSIDGEIVVSAVDQVSETGFDTLAMIAQSGSFRVNTVSLLEGL